MSDPQSDPQPPRGLGESPQVELIRADQPELGHYPQPWTFAI